MLVGGALLVRWLPLLSNSAALREWVQSFGPFAPLAFIAVQVFQVLVAPIPGQALGFASGYLFGAFWGTVYSLVGIVSGTALAVFIARYFGRPYVERVIDPAVLTRFDDLTATHGLSVLFLIFLIPGLPDDALCFAAGLTDIPVRRIVVVAAIGRLPGFLLVNYAGSAAANNNGFQAVLAVTVLLAVSVLGYLYREPLLSRLSEKIPSR